MLQYTSSLKIWQLHSWSPKLNVLCKTCSWKKWFFRDPKRMASRCHTRPCHNTLFMDFSYSFIAGKRPWFYPFKEWYYVTSSFQTCNLKKKKKHSKNPMKFLPLSYKWYNYFWFCQSNWFCKHQKYHDACLLNFYHSFGWWIWRTNQEL